MPSTVRLSGHRLTLRRKSCSQRRGSQRVTICRGWQSSGADMHLFRKSIRVHPSDPEGAVTNEHAHRRGTRRAPPVGRLQRKKGEKPPSSEHWPCEQSGSPGSRHVLRGEVRLADKGYQQGADTASNAHIGRGLLADLDIYCPPSDDLSSWVRSEPRHAGGSSSHDRARTNSPPRSAPVMNGAVSRLALTLVLAGTMHAAAADPVEVLFAPQRLKVS